MSTGACPGMGTEPSRGEPRILTWSLKSICLSMTNRTKGESSVRRQPTAKAQYKRTGWLHSFRIFESSATTRSATTWSGAAWSGPEGRR